MLLKFLLLFLIYFIPTTQAAKSEINRNRLSRSELISLAETDNANEKIIKTVTASGFGKSIEAASQNAVENALIQVVGSFIDAETLIKKRREIREGVISKTKIIKKDIKDYSQGSIKYFEILNIQENGSIVNITARVDVRIEDFRSYIKELASDTKEIESGLFTSIKADEDNLKNKLNLVGKILNPLIKAEVTKINIGNPQRLNNLSAFNCNYISSGYKISCPQGNQFFRKGGYNMSANGSIVIPITFYLDEDFKKNSLNILENISDQKTSSLLALRKSPVNFKNFMGNSYVITLFDSDTNVFTSYLISDVREHNKYKDRYGNSKEVVPVNAWNYCTSYFPKIKLSLLDKNKQSIWENKFQNCFGKELTYKDNELSLEFFYVSPDKKNGFIDPIYQNLYSYLNMSGKVAENVIFDQSRLLLIIEPKDNLLNTIKEIKLEYVTN